MNLKKLTTLQKALLGIAGAGLIVLLYDQFGGPAQVNAAGAPAVDVPRAAATSPNAAVEAAVAPPTPKSAPQSLGARLRATATDAANPPNDPFAKSLAPANSARASEATATTFASKYRMTGVMTSGNSRAAIINGVLVKRGQSIDGMRLIEVTATSATFQSGSGERIELRMRDETTDSSTPARRRGATTP
jgi:hypothetical protein